MSDPTPQPASPAPSPAPVRRTGNSVLCAACERLNPLGTEKCDRCGLELFANCRHCGTRNPRTSTRCPQCGRNQGNVRRSQMKSLWHSPVFWAVFVAGVGVVIALVLLFWLGGGRLPRI